MYLDLLLHGINIMLVIHVQLVETLMLRFQLMSQGFIEEYNLLIFINELGGFAFQ